MAFARTLNKKKILFTIGAHPCRYTRKPKLCSQLWGTGWLGGGAEPVPEEEAEYRALHPWPGRGPWDFGRSPGPWGLWETSGLGLGPKPSGQSNAKQSKAKQCPTESCPQVKPVLFFQSSTSRNDRGRRDLSHAVTISWVLGGGRQSPQCRRKIIF